VLCNRVTDIRVEHSIFGAIPCCERCCDVVGVQLPPDPPAGWRLVAHWKDWREDPVEQTYEFFNHDPQVALDNVLTSFKRWHPAVHPGESTLEFLGPIPPGAASLEWTEAFKRTPIEDDGIECSNCTPHDREDCEYPEGH
jgi:hypothetical protein